MKTSVTVGERGQVTIPKRLRDSLGLRPGTRLRFSERNGALIARRQEDDYAARLRSLIGILPSGDTDAWMRELRGPAWDPELDPPSLASRHTERGRRSRAKK